MNVITRRHRCDICGWVGPEFDLRNAIEQAKSESLVTTHVFVYHPNRYFNISNLTATEAQIRYASWISVLASWDNRAKGETWSW